MHWMSWLCLQSECKNAWTIYIYLADTLTQLIKQSVHSLNQDESTCIYCIVFAIKLLLHITHVVLAVSLFPPGLTANAPYRKANHLNKYNTGDTIREECEECQTPHRVITFTALEMFAQSVPRLSETRFIWQCTRYVIVYMYECTV